MTKAEALRALVSDLDAQDKDPAEIAAILGISVARVEALLDEQDPPHQEWRMAPAIEPLTNTPKAGTPLRIPPKAKPPRKASLKPPQKRAPSKPEPKPREVKPINHGTPAGWQAHNRRGEEACQPCKTAASETRKARKWQKREREGDPRRRPGSKPQPIPHGTPSGYRTHVRRGEDPCPDCRSAMQAKWRTERARRKAS